jgi:hypothetical protein
MDQQEQQPPKSDKPVGKERPKPQPGKFAVTQRVTMSQTAGEKGYFCHDETPVTQMAEVLSSRVHPSEERLNHDPQVWEIYRERVFRMVWMLMGRKLAGSLSDDQKAQYGGYLRSINNVSCSGPSALVPFLDLFGQVTTLDQEFEMIGQPLMAFSYFCRATYEPDGAGNAAFDRFRATFVNTHWPNWKTIFYEYCRAVVNAWARKAPHHQFAFANNVMVTMAVPEFTLGAVGYRLFVNAVNRPPYVDQALMVLTIMEPALNAAGLDEQQRNQLRAQQVWLVDWNPTLIAEAAQRYSLRVESRIRTSMAGCLNWVPIMAMKNHGSPGQLLHKDTEFIFTCPFLLGGEALDLGWLAAGTITMINVNPRTCNLTPRETVLGGMVNYVEGMMKKNF